MSDPETPADSAACALKERVNQAFEGYGAREVFNALRQAEDFQNKFLLLGTGLHLFTVDHDNVGYERVVRQGWAGEEKNTIQTSGLMFRRETLSTERMFWKAVCSAELRTAG